MHDCKITMSGGTPTRTAPCKQERRACCPDDTRGASSPLPARPRPAPALAARRRKQETRFLNKIEAQKGYEQGSSIGLIVEEGPAGAAAEADPGFTQAQLVKVSQAEALIEERDTEIRKVGRGVVVVVVAVVAAAAGGSSPVYVPACAGMYGGTTCVACIQMAAWRQRPKPRWPPTPDPVPSLQTLLPPQVVETIVELAQIMRDLSTLVVEQGTMLDRIDHNIVETAMKVGAALPQWGLGSVGSLTLAAGWGWLAPVLADVARAAKARFADPLKRWRGRPCPHHTRHHCPCWRRQPPNRWRRGSRSWSRRKRPKSPAAP
jgi:hypothetical protein